MLREQKGAAGTLGKGLLAGSSTLISLFDKGESSGGTLVSNAYDASEKNAQLTVDANAVTKGDADNLVNISVTLNELNDVVRDGVDGQDTNVYLAVDLRDDKGSSVAGLFNKSDQESIFIDASSMSDVINTIIHENYHQGDGSEWAAGAIGYLGEAAFKLGSWVNSEALAAYQPTNVNPAIHAGFNNANGQLSLLITNSSMLESMKMMGDDLDGRQLRSAESVRISALAAGNQQKETRLLLAGCALVKCSAQYSEGSIEYQQAKKLEDIGNSKALTGERALLEAQTLPGRFGGKDVELFEYTSGDKLKDRLSRIDNEYQISTRAFGALQTAGAIVTGAGSSALAAGGAASCPTTGFGCLALAGGAAGVVWSADQASAGTQTMWYGATVPTLGGTLLANVTGMSPQQAEIAYGVLGMSPAVIEAQIVNQLLNKSLKYNELSRASYADFIPDGIAPTNEVMMSTQVQALIKEIKAGGVAPAQARDYAATYVQAGTDLPITGVALPGAVLIKVVPKGDTVSPVSGFWMTPQQAKAIATMAPEEAGILMGLPAAQAARMQKNGMEFYAISPIPGVMPKVFSSVTAPTNQGSVTMSAGGKQVIVPNRTLWTVPEKVNPFTLQKAGEGK